ncbi:Uncharacterized protein HZ326_27134 [Fusarium oxysporum f. sp. albedinis]|nr:Uncharacterized protein HZ326_27134 [Fusarium oxysporum f. sp. albedinis]
MTGSSYGISVILAEGLIKDNFRSLLRDNLENIYDHCVPMLRRSTLPSDIASNDPRIAHVFQGLMKDSENPDTAISKLASVQLARLMSSLQSRIKTDRRSGRVVLGKRADSICYGHLRRKG